jgi:hypothetical protein
VELVLQGEEADLPVIWEHQAAPRIAGNYATVQILSDIATSLPVHSTTDDETDDKFDHHIDSPRQGTFAVKVYGPDHRDLSLALEMAVDDPSSQDHFTTTNVHVMQPIGGLPYEQVQRQTIFEGFTPIDFPFVYGARRTVLVDIIETVTANADEIAEAAAVYLGAFNSTSLFPDATAFDADRLVRLVSGSSVAYDARSDATRWDPLTRAGLPPEFADTAALAVGDWGGHGIELRTVVGDVRRVTGGSLYERGLAAWLRLAAAGVPPVYANTTAMELVAAEGDVGLIGGNLYQIVSGSAARMFVEGEVNTYADAAAMQAALSAGGIGLVTGDAANTVRLMVGAVATLLAVPAPSPAEPTLAAVYATAGPADGQMVGLYNSTTGNMVGVWWYSTLFGGWLPQWIDWKAAGAQGATIFAGHITAHAGAGFTWNVDGMRLVGTTALNDASVQITSGTISWPVWNQLRSWSVTHVGTFEWLSTWSTSQTAYIGWSLIDGVIAGDMRQTSFSGRSATITLDAFSSSVSSGSWQSPDNASGVEHACNSMLNVTQRVNKPYIEAHQNWDEGNASHHSLATFTGVTQVNIVSPATAILYARFKSQVASGGANTLTYRPKTSHYSWGLSPVRI